MPLSMGWAVLCLLFSDIERSTWESASVACQEAGSSLVEILNQGQLDFVRSQLFFLADVGVVGDWWTSGTDFGREDQKWILMSSLSAVADFVWHSGEPNGDTTTHKIACGWRRVLSLWPMMDNVYMYIV